MAVTLTINGVDFSFPQAGESPGWGSAVQGWASAVTSGMLQKAGGAFTLTADADFGATYGLKSTYYKSRATSVSSTGVVRLGNAEYLSWRNAADSADLGLRANSSDILEFNGNPITTLALGAANTVLKMNSGGTASEYGLLADANIDGSAAIAYSKLNLAGSLVDADINSAAAIAYSKLNLAGSLVDADINASAAIAYSKLAALTADRILASSGSGVVSALDTTTYPSLTELAYVKGVTSAIQTQIGTKVTKTGDALSGTFSGTPTFSGDVTFSSTGAITLPSGTSAQQPGSPANGMIRYNSDSTSFEGYAGGAWGSIGGASGGINYAEGSASAESGVGDWEAYDDAVAATPTDGTGGTPAVSITRSTSTPLRGTANFLVSKDAADRQGEGVSLPFTIDRADCNKVLSVKLDYDGSLDADYAADDIKVFIYDVTNATLIYPQGDNGLKAAQTSFATTFVATDSTSYRFILHVASVNAAAYTLSFDNVYIGPQELTYGVPMEDWVSFTPTGSWTTNVTWSGWYKLTGDCVELIYRIDMSAQPAETGNIAPNMPAGMTIDTTKLPNDAVDRLFGTVNIQDASTGNFYQAHLAWSSSTAFSVLSFSGTAYANVTRTAPFTFASGDIVVIRTTQPIPVAQLAGRSVWLSSAKAEYAYNSSTTTTTNSTDFAYGPTGKEVESFAPAATAFVNKRVRFLTHIQETDSIKLQFKNASTGKWVDNSY